MFRQIQIMKWTHKGIHQRIFSLIFSFLIICCLFNCACGFKSAVNLIVSNEDDSNSSSTVNDSIENLLHNYNDENQGIIARDEVQNFALNPLHKVDGVILLNSKKKASGTPFTEYNDLVKNCSTKCSINYDESLDECWIPTLTFFEHTLLGVMRRYITTQTNRVIWNDKHNLATNFTAMELESVHRLVHNPPPAVRDENNHLNRKDLKHIVRALLNDVMQKSKTIKEGGKLPRLLNCPQACERHADPFFILFVVSCSCTAVLAILILTMVIMLERREHKITKYEAHSYGENAHVCLTTNVNSIVPQKSTLSPLDNKTK